MTPKLILSLFPGIDLLGMAFEQAGYCVVRGPDPLTGGDIRTFHPPPNIFTGIIGGSPCQDFCQANQNPTDYGNQMLAEFIRCTQAAQPLWWLLENVPRVPDITVKGYQSQRLDLNAKTFGSSQSRLRHIQFGSRDGKVLVIPRGSNGKQSNTLTGSSSGSFRHFANMQGLPPDFDLPSFTIAGKKQAVANGVPLPLGQALAHAVQNRVFYTTINLCTCGCARPLTGKQTYATATCRSRMRDRRKKNGKPRPKQISLI